MPAELVSVVIPSYNYGRFVTQAVDSALAQRYPHVEIVVVDDGSTDDTRQRLAPYGDRVRYMYQQNQGLSAARNTGIRAARGQWIALLDADDAWHPRKLELQMHCLASQPAIDLLGTGAIIEQAACWPALDAPPCPAVEELSPEELVIRSHFAPSSVVARKRCLEEVGLFDPALRCVEDRDLWVRFGSRFRVARLPLPLLWYRLHATSLSTQAARMEENELRVIRRAFAEVPALRGRPLLRMRTLAYASFNSSYMYNTTRHYWPALRCLLRSMFLWPVPFRREEVHAPFARPRSLAVLLLRALGVAAPDKNVAAGATPPTRETVAPLSPA